jgi:3-keto-5-aminohexanoate cleavage enzyme
VITLPENKIIVTVAATGAMSTKAMNPAVPEQPEEIAQSAYEAYNEGAAIVHIHGRDRNNKPSGSKETFREIHANIRAKCGIIIQDSTGGSGSLSQQERVQCLEAQPEMASLNMGTLLRISGPYAGTLFSNPRSDIEAWATRMRELGIKPEMEVYHNGMVREVNNLIAKGLIEHPYYVNLVMGMPYQGAMEATPGILMSMLQLVPPDAFVNVCAVARAQLPITTMAMLMGCCVRVGFEDNLYYRRGELATSNAQLVARTVRIARELGKEPATPAEARQILGIKPLAE